MHIKDAAHEWVNGFNAIPQALITRAYKDSFFEDFVEVTPITVGSSVEYTSGESGYVSDIDKEKGVAYVEFYDGQNEMIDLHDLYLSNDSFLPMWGTMWTFGDSIDEWWLEDNLQAMAECGFRIYECDELGYVFGIDGAGYSFFEEHWIPLYKARGLRWHKTKEGLS